MNRYVFLKVFSVLIAVFSQILLKKSANKKYDNVIKEYLNLFVIIGYGLFFISSIMSVVSLRGISISLSSIIEALSCVLIPIVSYLILKEKINRKQILGMIIIIVGIIVFNL